MAAAVTRRRKPDRSQATLKRAYDYIVVGMARLARSSPVSSPRPRGKFSSSSRGRDTGPTVTNPSIWFHNVGSPSIGRCRLFPPQLISPFQHGTRRVLGGGSSVNAMVWTRVPRTTTRGNGTARLAGASRTCCDVQGPRDGTAVPMSGAASVACSRSHAIDPHPLARVSLEAARQMGFPIIDDMNGPCGRGWLHHLNSASTAREPARRAYSCGEPRPHQPHPALEHARDARLFEGDRAVAWRLLLGRRAKHFTGA